MLFTKDYNKLYCVPDPMLFTPGYNQLYCVPDPMLFAPGYNQLYFAEQYVSLDFRNGFFCAKENSENPSAAKFNK